MLKDILMGAAVGLAVAFIYTYLSYTAYAQKPELLLAAEIDQPKEVWMQCSALDENGVLADTGLILTPEGRFIRPHTDYKMKFKLEPAARGFWHALAETFHQRGIQFALIPIPPRGMRKGFATWQPRKYKIRAARVSWKQTLRHWQYLGVDVVDLLPTLSSLGQRTALVRDHHWSPDGARASALFVAQKLAQDSVLDALPRETYILESEEYDHVGSYAQQLNKRCSNDAPAEPLIIYSAIWQSEDIFGDAPEPVITFAGASNLNDEFSFVAHVQHALSLPVRNAGVSGGGFQHGILQVLETPRDEPLPYWLFWVVPGYLNELYGKKEIHREILAAAQGRCTDTNALEITQAIVQKNNQSFAFNRPNQTGALYMQIAQPIDDDGEFIWSKKSRMKADMRTNLDDRWQHTFTRHHNDLELFSLPLPTSLDWEKIRISLPIDEEIAAQAYLCASPYLVDWPHGIRFHLNNLSQSSNETQ